MTGYSLPAYTHIPGVTPHPLRDPAGHSYGMHVAEWSSTSTEQPVLTWNDVPGHPDFRWAVTLFNAGYYWESHEAWESLWHAAGRTGEIADCLKGLIKLAAAGVKLREHNVTGFARHTMRALELFQQVQAQRECESVVPDPLPLAQWIEMTKQLVLDCPPLPADRTGQPVDCLPQLPLA